MRKFRVVLVEPEHPHNVGFVARAMHCYALPELYRSVGIAEIEKNGWSLVPSKYIEFIDHDLEIDYEKEMGRIQREMRDVLAKERESQKMLEDAFNGIGFDIIGGGRS